MHGGVRTAIFGLILGYPEDLDLAQMGLEEVTDRGETVPTLRPGAPTHRPVAENGRTQRASSAGRVGCSVGSVHEGSRHVHRSLSKRLITKIAQSKTVASNEAF